MRTLDAELVFAQHTRFRVLEPGHQPKQGRLAAAGRSDELAGLDGEADIFQHGEIRAVDVEGVADVLDIERGAKSGFGDGLCNGARYHFTTPFCQTNRRSRVLNSRVMAPEHS